MENNYDYNYEEAVKESIREFLGESWVAFAPSTEADLFHEMLMSDTVTGNASGSFTFSTYKAEQCLAHNWDLLKEALEWNDADPFEMNPEGCDVTIRCYLLETALDDISTNEVLPLSDTAYERLIKEIVEGSHPDYTEVVVLDNAEDVEEGTIQVYQLVSDPETYIHTF